MTLTDFLLARIAEDEAECEEWPDDLPPLAPDGHVWRDPKGHAIYHPRLRVLADCQARRRIVELHRESRTTPGTCAVCAEWAEQYPCRTLDALVLPYVDHPDYPKDVQRWWQP